jgi:pyridoxal phosphate-dependent aminotransferase EpsN
MHDHDNRIYLSPPHLGELEAELVADAIESNWIAPLGPHVEAFEREFSAVVEVPHSAALVSGTAGLHLALVVLGVRPGDTVLVSSLTFVASANAIAYTGAVPAFVDSETASWNMDPDLLAEALAARARTGSLPAAVVVVDIYGQPADYDRILPICEKYDVPVVEDAAEALGASYKGRPVGAFGACGVYSFNGNKIITTSGGGMLVSDDPGLVKRTRHLSTQARDPAPHYEHSSIGYNYRMSNLLAAVGRGQLKVLDARVDARRRVFDNYRDRLGDLPGLGFMPEPTWARSTRWLTCLTINPAAFGATREEVRKALEAENIESRPLWKPMHLQPVFRGCDVFGGEVSSRLFDQGLCLPSGSALTDSELDRITDLVRACAGSR